MAKAQVSKPIQPAKLQTGSWGFVRPSLELWRQNIETGVVLVLLPSFLTELGTTLSSDNLTKLSSGTIVIALGFLWSLINAPALYYFLVQAAKGKRPTIAASYRYGFKRFWRILGLRILVYVIVIVGFLLLIVPGIIMLRRYYLANYYLIDKDLSIKQAMQQSADESKPVSVYVYSLIGVSIFFGVIAELVGGIGGPIGSIIGLLIGFIYLFGTALRYIEVSSGKKSPAIKD